MPRKVTVNTGFSNVQLPNGLFYNANDSVVLSDEQAAKLLGNVFSKTVVNSAGNALPVLIDNGSYGTTTGNAGARPTISAVTSSQNSTTNAATQTSSYVQGDVQLIATLANALKVSYNAAQVDIAALRVEVLALTNALVTAGIASGTTQS
jgi:hypothetical protein